MDSGLEKLTQSNLLLLHKYRRLGFLTLRELEPFARLGATRLLAFNFSCIPREKTTGTHYGT
jgi:hypothetical protein